MLLPAPSKGQSYDLHRQAHLTGGFRRHCRLQGGGAGPALDLRRGPGQGGDDRGGPGIRGAPDLPGADRRAGGRGHVRAWGGGAFGARLPGAGGGRHHPGPGHCQSHREAGRGDRRRSADHRHAGGHPAGAAVPGHERRHVGLAGGPGESGPPPGPGSAGDGARQRRVGLRRRGPGPAAGAAGDCGGWRPLVKPSGFQRPAAAGDCRADSRRPGPGALPQQPLQRQDGLCPGESGLAPGGPGVPDQRSQRPGGALRSGTGLGQVRPGRCWTRCRKGLSRRRGC